MRRVAWVVMATLVLGACESDDILVVDDGFGAAPAAPVNLDAFYYAGAVTVTWELGAGWNGEAFRVYAKRVADPDFFFIAEVTSCATGLCTYEDLNVAQGTSYEYYVAAVDPGGGVETASEFSVRVDVPLFTAPPVPAGLQVVALDGANYLKWGQTSRDAEDFSFYRVYLDAGDGQEFLLGETDSEGFLDELAQNGETYRYFVSAVDQHGHESAGGGVAAGTPRPDFHGEWVYAFGDEPALSGFRFETDEGIDPIVLGTDPSRAFRLEVDAFGWWLVPGPGASIYPQGFVTTALKCGVAADAGCVDVVQAPTSGYQAQDVSVESQTSYVFQVVADDGLIHYGVIRVELLGFDQDDRALMIFDWAYQSQADNPNLADVVGVPLR